MNGLETVLKRVAKLMSFRYDCPVRFLIPDMIETSRDQELLELVNRNSKSRLIISRKDLIMPIQNDQGLALIALMEGGSRMLPSQMEHVRNALDLVMAGIYNKTSANSNRVVDIEDVVAKTSSLNLINEDDSYARGERENVVAPKIALLVEAPKTAPVRELALEIHNLSKQQFFISIHDLSAEALQNIEDFKQLGNMTLFIPDVAKLERRLQKLIASYLENFEVAERDMKIIATVEGNINQLVKIGVVDSGFAELIQEGVLVWPDNLERKSTIGETLEALFTGQKTQTKPRLMIVKNDLH